MITWFLFGFILVHPCDKADKGGCEQTCEKKGEEEYICSCPVGYKLNDDGKKCDKSKSFIFIPFVPILNKGIQLSFNAC